MSVPGVLRRAIESGDPYAGFARHLAQICGGVGPLERLTSEPHVRELIEKSAVPEVDRELVNQVLAVIDTVSPDRLDPEYRIILHRLVVTAATHDRRPLRRRTSPTRLAAALAWITLKGNIEIGRRSRWVAEDIWYWFGVSNCAGLARKIATALDMTPTVDSFGATRFQPGGITLGDVGLLHSRTRARLITQRAEAIEVIEHFEARREAALPIVHRGGGLVELRAREVKVLRAMKANADGRLKILVLLGNSIEKPEEIIAFSVPDAWRLVGELQAALEAPQSLTAS